MFFSQPEVRYILTERIKALKVKSTYGTVGTDEWREADEPLLPETGPETWRSLDFFVDDRDQDDTGVRGPEADRVQQLVVVRFVFEVLPMAKKTSWDKAALAAEDLRSWLRYGRGTWQAGLQVGPAAAAGQPRFRRLPMVRAEAVTEEQLEYRLTHIAVEIPLRVTYDAIP